MITYLTVKCNNKLPKKHNSTKILRSFDIAKCPTSINRDDVYIISTIPRIFKLSYKVRMLEIIFLSIAFQNIDLHECLQFGFHMKINVKICFFLK